MKIYSKIYTEFLLFSLCWVVKKEKNCFTIQKLSIYTVKESETGPNPQNTPGGNPKKKKSPTHCSMSRPQVDVATWNYLDGSLSIATSSFQVATCLISGRHIEVMSRHLLFSVPLVLMSRPQNDVATSLSSYSSSVCAATSFLGCDHLDVCMMTSCCNFDS